MNYFTATVPDTLSSWCYCKHISWFHRHLDKGSAVSLHNFCYGNKYVLRNRSSSKLHRYHNRNQSGRLLDKLWEYWIRIRIPANLIPKHDVRGIRGNLKNAWKGLGTVNTYDHHHRRHDPNDHFCQRFVMHPKDSYVMTLICRPRWAPSTGSWCLSAEELICHPSSLKSILGRLPRPEIHCHPRHLQRISIGIHNTMAEKKIVMKISSKWKTFCTT